VLSVLKIEVSADETPFGAVVNEWDSPNSRLDVRELVELERDIRFQEIEVARICQHRYCPIQGLLDHTQLRRVAGHRASLIEAIDILRQPLRIDRRGERIGAADTGDIVLDALDLGLVTGQSGPSAATRAPPDRGNAAETLYRFSTHCDA